MTDAERKLLLWVAEQAIAAIPPGRFVSEDEREGRRLIAAVKEEASGLTTPAGGGGWEP